MSWDPLMVEGTCEGPQPCRPQMYKVPCADSRVARKLRSKKGDLAENQISLLLN